MKRLCTLIILTTYFARSLFLQLASQPGVEEDVLQVGERTSCNRVYRNQTFGILASPYYPLAYPDDTLCVWVVQIEEGKRIVVSIKRFILGPGDRLEVFGDANEERSVYSLRNPPDDVIYSSVNYLKLSLTSANNRTNVEDPTVKALKANRTFYAIFEVEGCGGTLRESSGHINVPSYIHLSPRSHECAWTIIGPKNKVVILNFIQFDLTPGTCLYSKLHIRDGDRRAGYILGDFCEENPPLQELRTATNIMSISYRSRPNFLSKQSEIIPIIRMYYYIGDPCGGVFSSFSGSFYSPRWWMDDVYVCNWTINIPIGKQISLKIYNWKILNSTDEEYDELSLNVPSKRPRIWTSREKTKPRQSTIIPSNQVTISLQSHSRTSSVAKIEFYCVYEAIPTPLEQCIDVGSKRLFMCDEWKFIDCDLRCNGEFDCDTGKDEEDCKYDNSLGIRHEHHKKSINISVYFTFLFVAICVSLVIVVASLTFNHCYKANQKKNEAVSRRTVSQAPFYPSVYPPPYRSKDTCTISQFYRTPPAYPYSFDETNITDDSSLRQSLVAVSVANQSMNDTQSTTDTDRLRDFDIPYTEYNSRSMDTLFMIEEGTFEESDGSYNATSTSSNDETMSPILPSTVPDGSRASITSKPAGSRTQSTK